MMDLCKKIVKSINDINKYSLLINNENLYILRELKNSIMFLNLKFLWIKIDK